jgi:MOSC domain-containing protein YiiM
MSRAAEVVAVCVGPGGIPKPEVESCAVGVEGLEGDGHRFHRHGGPNRAVCLLAEEVYEALREDDVDCTTPGTFGENVLTRGLDDAALRPGDRLRLGDQLVIEIHDVRAPCATLKGVDKRFPELMVGRSGWVCRVIEPGILRRGATIEHLPANP